MMTLEDDDNYDDDDEEDEKDEDVVNHCEQGLADCVWEERGDRASFSSYPALIGQCANHYIIFIIIMIGIFAHYNHLHESK